MGKSANKRYTEQERGEMLRLYRQSGHSASRFCREMNLGYPTLKRWLGKASASSGLVEVAAGEEAPADSLTMNIRLPNGIECGLVSRLTIREAITLMRGLKRC